MLVAKMFCRIYLNYWNFGYLKFPFSCSWNFSQTLINYVYMLFAYNCLDIKCFLGTTNELEFLYSLMKLVPHGHWYIYSNFYSASTVKHFLFVRHLFSRKFARAKSPETKVLANNFSCMDYRTKYNKSRK